MAEFHFVEDYETHVANLIAAYPLDEAMALAVGGSYEYVGSIEADIVEYAGLTPGISVFDMGCGSGRLSHALGKRMPEIQYLGTDVVQALLDYAKSKSPAHFNFKVHRALSVPLDDSSIDIACAFSVFTHLLHHETFIYMKDIYRALKPGGKLIFSFLEFSDPKFWSIFEATVDAQTTRITPQLNIFIERNAIELWAAKIGFGEIRFIDGTRPLGANGHLGQALALLTRTV